MTGLERIAGEHGHILEAPDLGATTPDTTAAAQATAVAVKGRQFDQRGDLLAIKCLQARAIARPGLRLPKTLSGMTRGWAYGNEAADGRVSEPAAACDPVAVHTSSAA
jgi:hypothetical protein